MANLWRRKYLGLLLITAAVIVIAVLKTPSSPPPVSSRIIPDSQTNQDTVADPKPEPTVSSEIVAKVYTPPLLSRTYHYCLAVKGVDAANLTDFGAKVASV